MADSRKPEACGTCHSGADHINWEAYNGSQHGLGYQASKNRWNWNLQMKDMVVKGGQKFPTCQSCHFEYQGKFSHNTVRKVRWANYPFVPGIREAVFDAWGMQRYEAWVKTCTTCHSITHVNSTKGNGDYTIENPEHYPFAYSKNAVLQWVNNQLVKAKPELHKKTFLKDLHKSAEFCSTCHKVHLPYELNHYKEFLRGQNHYDTYLLSGVSGHGARSFYYPEKAVQNCAGCHMPLQESTDFGARNFADAKKPSIHNHLFPSANTGLAWLKELPDTVTAHQEFLKGKLRVDIFGVKEGGEITGKLHAPIRPEVPTLKPGQTYLLEAVVRTLKMGHPFTQGTVDSNEVWVDVTVTSGGKIIGRSGGLDENRSRLLGRGQANQQD